MDGKSCSPMLSTIHTARYPTPSQPFNDTDIDSHDELGVPTCHRVRLTNKESYERHVRPVHLIMSFLQAIIIIFCVAPLLIPMALIVVRILPGTPDTAQDGFGKRSPDPTADTTLSWASASWALVAIAINTMCQPFGKILGLPAKHSFALRASPLVCIADSFDMITLIFYSSIKTSSLFEGVSMTVRDRFTDVQPNDDGSFGALRNNTVFRVLLFLLGALPQTIKLCAVRGARWTQILAGIYLFSFLLAEIAAAIARRNRVEQVLGNMPAGKSNKYKSIVTLGVLVISVSLVYLFFTAAIFTIMRDHWTLAAWPLILSACLLNILYIYGIAASKRDLLVLYSGLLIIISGPFLSAASPLVLASILVTTAVTPQTPPFHWHDQTYSALLSGTVLIYVATTSVSFYRLTRNVSSRYASYVHFELDAYFFLVHLVTLFLGSAFLYDPTPTRKPSWTDALG